MAIQVTSFLFLALSTRMKALITSLKSKISLENWLYQIIFDTRLLKALKDITFCPALKTLVPFGQFFTKDFIFRKCLFLFEELLLDLLQVDILD
jgi:hypothetical protein